jgi:methyl-accepting chemotaxis protein
MARLQSPKQPGPAIRSSIGRRILGAFAVILVVILVNAGINALLLDNLSNAALQERSKTNEQALLDRLSFLLNNQIAVYELLIWSRADRPTAVTNVDTQIDETLTQLKKGYPGLFAAAGQLHPFDESYTKLRAILDQAATFTAESPPNYDKAQAVWREGLAVIPEPARLLNSYRAMVKDERDRLGAQQDTARQTAIVTSLVTTAGSLILALVLAVLLARQILRPVAQLKVALRRVAEGDLAPSRLIHSKDEIGDLLTTFDATLGRLRDLLAAIQGQSQTITSEAGQLKQQAAALGQRTTQEATATQQTLATIDELAHAAARIAQSTTDVTASNEQIHLAVADSRRVVEATTGEMTLVRQRVQAVSAQIQALEGHTQAIESIVGLMGEIATETHLLALNAAIEAAGAGEFGTRFAIIAGQVRDLASQANNASDQIRTLIENVQQAVEMTVNLSDAGVAEVDRGVSLVGDLEQVHQQIEGLVRRTIAMTTEIAQATHQQRDGSQQVTQTMGQLLAVAQENAAQSRDTIESVSSLSAVAEYLQRAADQFHLDR